MNVETMRREIAKAYTGDAWKHKVKALPEYQVIAVYHDFQKTGLFETNSTTKPKGNGFGRQLTLDDIKRGF